jgi:hypothetical protein
MSPLLSVLTLAILAASPSLPVVPQRAGVSAWHEPVTWFTFALVAVGIVQIFVYWKQKNLMAAAIKAQRRPRFVMREIAAVAFYAETLEITLTIANAGESAGTITESVFASEANDFRALKPLRIEPGNNHFGSISLAPGEQTTLTRQIPLTDGMKLDFATWGDEIKNKGPRYHYLRGFIVYRDANGISRRMAFCRYFNNVNHRFERTDDPDFEYD